MAFAFLKRWLAGSRKARTDLHVVLYTRRACPLCEEALEVLRRFQECYAFPIEIKDIDESADLVSAYGNCVPVVTINGKVRFRGHVNEVLLQRLLEA